MYGFVPNQLISFSLECCSIYPIWVYLLKSYYGGFWDKSFSPTATYSCHKHLRGIFTGCIVSIKLFLAGMTTLIGNDNSNFQSLLFPSVNAFMDDLFLMCCSARDSSPFGSCIALSLARISVNRFKSRNFVFEKRRILNENVLSVVINKNKYSIPPISEKSVKFLGRTISGS